MSICDPSVTVGVHTSCLFCYLLLPHGDPGHIWFPCPESLCCLAAMDHRRHRHPHQRSADALICPAAECASYPLSPHSTRLAATMAVTPAYASSICRALLNLTHLPLAPSFVEKLME
jgi:hypothetical protein